MKQFLFLFGLSLLVLAGCKKESAPVEQNYDIYVLGKTPNSSSGPFLLWKNGEVVQTLPYNVDKNYDLLVLPGKNGNTIRNIDYEHCEKYIIFHPYDVFTSG